MDHVCLVFVMLSRLFIVALWPLAGKGLTSWLLFVTFIVFLLHSHVVSWVSVVLDCVVSWSLYSEQFFLIFAVCIFKVF